MSIVLKLGTMCRECCRQVREGGVIMTGIEVHEQWRFQSLMLMLISCLKASYTQFKAGKEPMMHPDDCLGGPCFFVEIEETVLKLFLWLPFLPNCLAGRSVRWMRVLFP